MYPRRGQHPPARTRPEEGRGYGSTSRPGPISPPLITPPSHADKSQRRPPPQFVPPPRSSQYPLEQSELQNRFKDIAPPIEASSSRPSPMSRRESQDPPISQELFGTSPASEDISQRAPQTTLNYSSHGRYNFPPVSIDAPRRAPANPTQAYQELHPGPDPATSRMWLSATYEQAPTHASEFQSLDGSSFDPEGSSRYMAGSPSGTVQRSTHPGRHHPRNPAQPAAPSNREKPWPTRKRTNHDEFDGDFQLLPESAGATLTATEENLLALPTNMRPGEQELALNQLELILCECAFKVMAKYQFPIPVEEGKKLVEHPSDRTWNEWAYILKRLATKRRIPARILYEERIKQMITVLENSVDVRPAAGHRSRALKDDRYILQMISAGIQVTKLFMDAENMERLSELYEDTETVIRTRTGHTSHPPTT